jgi:hypothetical protein
MQPPASADYLSLTHRPDMGVMVARWQREPLQEELQQGYWQMLGLSVAQQCWYWLIDCRRRDNANSQNVQWMMEAFFPALAAQLAHPVYLAYLFSPQHLADIEADDSVPDLTYFDDRPYHVQRFIDEHHAMEWLANCQLADKLRAT